MSTTVMVVENEGYVLEAMEIILKSAGLQLIGLQSGQESVAIFKDRYQEIDLVLLDWHLPDLAGSDVLNQLQKINPKLKVIISTGYDEKYVKRHLATAVTPVSILRKPYNAQTLLNRVQDELGQEHTRFC